MVGLRNISAYLLVLLGPLGCTSKDDEVFQGTSSVENRPPVTQKLGSDADDTEKPPSYIQVSFAVTVRSRLNLKVCSGKAEMQFNSNFQLKVPEAVLKCVGFDINIGKMLAAQDQKKKPEYSTDGLVFRVNAMGNTHFDPPRPVLLGPIIQDPAKYENFHESESYQVTVDDAPSPKTGRGEIEINVLGVNQAFSSPAFPNEFNSVIHWEMLATGFEGVPVASALLFDRIEFYWNIRPVMVPKIVIEGTLTDFISQDPNASGVKKILSGIGSAILGKLIVELVADEYHQ